jgi:hypothetical protein
MMGKLGRCEGPSLMLVKDKEGGHVMGGFAAAPWIKSGSYFGDYSTFIFGLSPATLVSSPSVLFYWLESPVLLVMGGNSTLESTAA